VNKTYPVDNLPILTDHARQRMAQRNLRRKDVAYIMGYGRTFHRAGAVFVHLRRKDIPVKDRYDPAITRLEGATIVLSDTESVIMTVWRNRDQGLRQIRRKRR
jgi:hypothetical protein